MPVQTPLSLAQEFHAELPPDDALPYDRWQQKSVHNAYDRYESIRAQLGEHGFRSVEIDIHERRLGLGAKSDDWWVYHVGVPGFDGTSCDTLSECLAEVEAFRSDAPEHEVLTVFIDLKDEFNTATHRPRDLDARIRASFPRGALYEPRDLLQRCPDASDLRDAVAGTCGWPTLRELRGRVMVALTGGHLCRSASPLRAYLDDRSGDHAAFIAPQVSDECGLETQARTGEAIFFNLAGDAFHHAKEISRMQLVSRGFWGGLQGGIDDPGQWLEALEAGVNILATNRVDGDRDPWTNVLTLPRRPAPRTVASRSQSTPSQ